MVKDTEKEADSKAVAEHEMLNAAGESPDDLDDADAVGYRYTLLGNKQSVEVMWDKLKPEIQRAAGLFGIKTRLTNDTSGVRNQAKGRDANGKAIKPYENDYDLQIQAVRDSLADWDRGIWVDRTREPGAPRVNREALAQAVCQYYVATGKRTNDQVGVAGSGGEYDKTLARLNDSKDGLMAMARTIGEVQTYYNAIVGRKVATVDDLLGT